MILQKRMRIRGRILSKEDDVDRDAWEYMRKKGRDVEVEPPQKMTTCSQTKAVVEDQKQSSLEM
jgi:hypothetical protein